MDIWAGIPVALLLTGLAVVASLTGTNAQKAITDTGHARPAIDVQAASLTPLDLLGLRKLD